MQSASTVQAIELPETDTAHHAVRVPVQRRSLLRAMLGAVGAAMLPTVAFSPSIGVASPPAMHMLPPAPRGSTASTTNLAEWHSFKARFISAEGRVVDTGNGGISHSEGQGYGMLLAEWANDRPTFERILAWTRANMSRPSDTLHAWSWNPASQVKARDQNTATDGELSIAWALLRAADRWGVAEWRTRAHDMARDIMTVSAREAGGRLFLSPGAVGFDRADRIVINPSYYNFPAIRALAAATRDDRWAQIEIDGLWLLDHGRFGRFSLPADWVEIMIADADIRPATGRQLMFSWDALRVPLYLAWAGETNAPALASAVRFWNVKKGGAVPAWTDLRSGVMAPYPGHAGVLAIARLSTAALNGQGQESDMPTQASAPDYYAAALALLARVAWQECQAIHHSPVQIARS